MKKHKISMYVSLFVAIILILYMFAPIFSLADNEELNIDLSKVEFEGEYVININASSPSKIIEISYINEKKTISDFNNNAEAIIAFFEGDKTKKVEFDNNNFVNKYIKIINYGDYTVYLRNEDGEIQLSYITIEEKKVLENTEDKKVLTQNISENNVVINNTSDINESVDQNENQEKTIENSENDKQLIENINNNNINQLVSFNIIKNSLEPIDLNDIKNEISTSEVKENGNQQASITQTDVKVTEQNSINNNSEIDVKVTEQNSLNNISESDVKVTEQNSLNNIYDNQQEFVDIKEVNNQEIIDIKENNEQPFSVNISNSIEKAGTENIIKSVENAEIIDISNISDKSDFKDIKDVTKTAKTVKKESIKITEENSEATKIYPQTGTNDHIVLIGILISLGVSVFSYYKIKN